MREYEHKGGLFDGVVFYSSPWISRTEVVFRFKDGTKTYGCDGPTNRGVSPFRDGFRAGDDADTNVVCTGVKKIIPVTKGLVVKNGNVVDVVASVGRKGRQTFKVRVVMK